MFLAILFVISGLWLSSDSLCIHGMKRSWRSTSALKMVAKFDPTTYLKVSCEKPLGLELDEVEVDAPRGVTVTAVDPTGFGKIAGVYAGLFLVSIGGVDVKYKDFDAILDMIGAAESPLALGKFVNLTQNLRHNRSIKWLYIRNLFIALQYVYMMRCVLVNIALTDLYLLPSLIYSEWVDPRNVFKGSAEVEVTTSAGEKMNLKALKGQNLREVLLGTKCEIYQGSEKMTNCGGGVLRDVRGEHHE